MEYSSVDYQTKESICSMDCKTSKKYFNPVFFVLKNAKKFKIVQQMTKRNKLSAQPIVKFLRGF